MNKKKILIVNNNMRIGGVQRALVNLLKNTHDRYEIDLALFSPTGELMKDIPADVKIIPIRSAYRFLGMTKYDVQHNPVKKLMRSFFAAVCRLMGRDAAIALMALGQKKLSGYDAVISYLHDAGDRMFYGGCNDFVIRHTDAKRKCTFLHCDFMNCGANTSRNRQRYARFQHIAACSEGCRDAFVKANPELNERTVIVPNCQDFDFIHRSAQEDSICLSDNCINVLTVARLGREKGVPRAIEALSRMQGLEKKYHYYIVGDGSERQEVEAMINRCGLDEKVTLLGERANPYGYMQAADLLLIPSFSEAAPMVIGEAACLGTPVLSTETTSAKDMVEQTGYGWVCGNSVDGIAQGLRQLLSNADLLKERKQFLSVAAFDNERAVECFHRLVCCDDMR